MFSFSPLLSVRALAGLLLRSHVSITPSYERVRGYPPKGVFMFTTEQYRAKAREYAEWAKATISPKEAREFNMLERSFTTLADNEQWLAENHNKTVNAHKDDIAVSAIELAAQEEHVLRCLGAALILQWNTLTQKLQRELFDNASSMGELLDTVSLRGQIARFLHSHKDD